jgi:hypothetical protein
MRYDIRQFQPVLYLVLILGMTGYALAAQSPGIWVFSVGMVVAHWWLRGRGYLNPIPRWLANLVTVGSALFVLLQVRPGMAAPILVIGQFLILLQLVKLYEQRQNRDAAQLLVLSLLLVVAASINTASLLFGIVLIAYLLLSLYGWLLFHLKVESDAAARQNPGGAGVIHAQTALQDQRLLGRSMRRLTAMVSVASVTVAVIVFLLFPRGTGAGVFGPLQWRPAQAMTGFSERVSFQNIAQITQSQEVVGYVQLLRNGQLVRGTSPLLWRGTTLDVYTGSPRRDSGLLADFGAFEWLRSDTLEEPDEFLPGSSLWFEQTSTAEEWTQRVTLAPTNTRVLFAIAGVREFKPQYAGRLSYLPRDCVLLAEGQLPTGQIKYEVVSTGIASENNVAPGRGRMRSARTSWRRFVNEGQATQRPAQSSIDRRIAEYARRPDVSGSDFEGPLAERRPSNVRVSPLDMRIAAAIEQHLRQNFSYTLDLRDARNLIAGQDPLVGFLYDFRRGHCEYFAGAMTLMCQSLGMQARMVVGFRVDGDAYNEIGEYYVVRQSHAHAWVEVLSPDGVWVTFDPTSARVSQATGRITLWQRALNFINYLEYTWADRVVTYDRDSRAGVWSAVERSAASTMVSGQDMLSTVRDWFDNSYFQFSSRVIRGAIWLMVFLMLGAVLHFLWEKWRLSRRARRIGLAGMPSTDRIRLARQLGFYDDLLRLLARHRIVRAPNQTPLEFSKSLVHLPGELFDQIARVTQIYYRVRYGGVELSSSRLRKLDRAIDEISQMLGTATRLTHRALR